MDVERLLIAKCVREGVLHRAVSRGIEQHHFVGRAVGTEPATADVWSWLTEHLRHYRAAPSEGLFGNRWPGFVMLEGPDPIEAVLDEFVRVVKRRKLIEQIRHLSTVADDWELVDSAEVHVQEAARELARLVPTTAAHRYSDSLDRLELYRQRESLGRSPGVSTLIDGIDDWTYGVQPHETMVVEGFLNIGKSSLMCGMAARAYFERGETPLFMTLEMEGDKLAQRWDAYAADISYRAMKRLELGEGDLAKWEKIGEKASDAKFEKDIIVIDDLWHPSVEKVHSEVEQWQPAFTIIDPIDEIQAPSQYRSLYERQGYAIREIKAMGRVLKRPFIVAAQAGREAEQEGATLGNIAGSIDIARKADIVVALHADAQMQKQKKMRFTLAKNRDDEGKGASWDYFVDVAKMIYRPWKPEDATPVQQPVG